MMEEKARQASRLNWRLRSPDLIKRLMEVLPEPKVLEIVNAWEAENDLAEETKKNKEELLEHYARREPTRFLQLDAWVGVDGDSLITPDKEGDWICWSTTDELMLGPSIQKGGGTRVLIPPKTKVRDAVRVLRKIARIIEERRTGLKD